MRFVKHENLPYGREFSELLIMMQVKSESKDMEIKPHHIVITHEYVSPKTGKRMLAIEYMVVTGTEGDPVSSVTYYEEE